MQRGIAYQASRAQIMAPPMSPQDQQIYHDDRVAAILSVSIFACNLLLALLLASLPFSVWRLKRLGILLHWWFVLIKLPLGIVAGTSILNALSQSSTMGIEMDFPLGTHIAWAGVLYPICLIFVLRGKMFRVKPSGAATIGPSATAMRAPRFSSPSERLASALAV